MYDNLKLSPAMKRAMALIETKGATGPHDGVRLNTALALRDRGLVTTYLSFESWIIRPFDGEALRNEDGTVPSHVLRQRAEAVVTPPPVPAPPVPAPPADAPPAPTLEQLTPDMRKALRRAKRNGFVEQDEGVTLATARALRGLELIELFHEGGPGMWWFRCIALPDGVEAPAPARDRLVTMWVDRRGWWIRFPDVPTPPIPGDLTPDMREALRRVNISVFVEHGEGVSRETALALRDRGLVTMWTHHDGWWIQFPEDLDKAADVPAPPAVVDEVTVLTWIDDALKRPAQDPDNARAHLNYAAELYEGLATARRSRDPRK